MGQDVWQFIPKEIIQEVEEYLPESDKARLAQAAKQFYKTRYLPSDAFPLFNTSVHLKFKRVQELLKLVVDSKTAEVEAMLKADVGLLLEAGTVRDHSKRLFKGWTPFQLAIANDDFAMYEMMEKFFTELPHGINIRLQQFKEKFSNLEKPRAYNFQTFFDSIGKEKFINEEQRFKNYFTPDPNQLITKGKAYDMKVFLDAINCYEKNYYKFKNWHQSALYCQVVFGTLLKLFTVANARLYCHLTDDLKLEDGSDFYHPDLGVKHYIAFGDRTFRTDGIPKCWQIDGIKKIYEDNINRFEALENRMRPSNREQFCNII